MVTLILAIACHASAEVFILGAGSSLAVALAQHQGRKRIAAGAEPSGLIGRLRR